MKDAGPGRGRVLSVGRVYCDLVFTGLRADAQLRARRSSRTACRSTRAGGAAITAGWLAALGRPSSLASVLPAAPFDAPVRDELSGLGVDLSACRGGTGGPQMTVAMAMGDDRAFLTRATGPAAPPLTSADLLSAGVAHLHVGELRTLRERPDLIDAARHAGATLSADCAWEDGLDAEGAALVRRLDLFLPNEREMARLDAHGAAPAPLTVVKGGADGAVARTQGGTLAAPGRTVRVVDATGAGDAFDAGFLDRWLSGADLADALAAGNRAGAAAVTAPGGLGGVAALAG